MGRSRFLHRGLIGLLLLAGCSGEEPLLVAGDVASVYAGGQGSDYGPSSMDEGVRGAIGGRVRFDGRGWSPRLLDMGSDEFCVSAHTTEVLSEDWQVGPDGGLAGAIVYIKKGLEREKFDPPAEPVVLDQRGCRYIPHVAVVQTGQELLIRSSDRTLHNVNGRAGPNDGFNHAMPAPGTLAPKVFRKPEVAKRIGCDVHGWMVSWVAAIPHPFHAITGADGSFRLENVPPGSYLLAVWHEKVAEGRFEELTAEITVEPNGEVTQEFLFERS